MIRVDYYRDVDTGGSGVGIIVIIICLVFTEGHGRGILNLIPLV